MNYSANLNVNPKNLCQLDKEELEKILNLGEGEELEWELTDEYLVDEDDNRRSYLSSVTISRESKEDMYKVSLNYIVRTFNCKIGVDYDEDGPYSYIQEVYWDEEVKARLERETMKMSLNQLMFDILTDFQIHTI